MHRATISEVSVQVFLTTTKLVHDSDGHAHPGAARPVTRALLTITDTEGQQGRCLAQEAQVSEALLGAMCGRCCSVRTRSTAGGCGRGLRAGSGAAREGSVTGPLRWSSRRCGT